MKERDSQRQAEEFKRHTAYPESYRARGGSNNLWLGIIIGGLSALVLFLAYQLFTSRQASNTANNTQPIPLSTVPNPSSNGTNIVPVNPTGGTTSTSAPVASPVPNLTDQVSISNAGIQRSQFVQPAFRNKGQIELLKVNRIPGERDVVNVQARIRLLQPAKAVGSDAIYMGGTTARNPQTSETYAAVNGESTGSVSLFSMRLENQTSADAYVWLQVPEGVNTINIYIPSTQAFQNVPISN